MAAEPTPLLTPAQRRIAAFALTLLALVGSAALIIGAFVVLGGLAAFFSGVLWPLAVAGVLALVLQPVVGLLQRWLHLRRTAAVILLYGLFLLVVAGIVVLLLPPVVEQLLNFIAYTPRLWGETRLYVEQKYPVWSEAIRHQLAHPAVQRMADTLAEQAQGLVAHALPSLRAAGGGVAGILAFITHVAIIPVYLFFFLLARPDPTRKLRDHLPFLPEGARDDVVFLAREFVAIVESFFRGQLLIGLIMGGLLATGFTLVGLDFGLVLGLSLGLLNIVPYLGTIVGLAVALPLAFFQPDGGWRLVGLVLLVKVVVQCAEAWVLTPRIMGERTGLHPVAIIVAVFFWGTAFGGVVGMLLAIPLTAFFVTAWRLARRKYLGVAR
ncbi:MAG TPA: AI-2E family transporter [Opitutaceae bacterium]|nr:AI-2E family transporter [Opitutaceae bacterium]